MEHNGTATAGAGELEGGAIIRFLLDGGLQIDMVGQLALPLFSCRLYMSTQLIALRPHMDGARTDKAGGADGLSDHGGVAMIIAHQLHIHGIGVLGGADNAEGIAGERLCIETDAYVEIGYPYLPAVPW